ncbi:DUF1566 domain-containing protein, partial [candidate division KSB1 bacterium]|nr:DUF1566 domain-containing protein [candidate division KSB1 bacterium]NIR72006.1 DUF1566 domain-containing protein [candidate division KSB1 bacterium]NIS24999.1 DUF1566 domain-containing protein [candidate division KSB1 bacterium]NIT71915.1 DUF1566 domain-containing protein [candidate division KSB1 bacterium]NIU25654.1 DUF1566 domain-containing protein [candidate division KSB1 bacterium]
MLKASLNESGTLTSNLSKVDLTDLPEPIYQFRNRPQRTSEAKAAELIRRFDFYCKSDYSWSNPNGKGIPHDYQIDSSGEVVYDACTGLRWQKSGSPERLTFKRALAYIAQLNRQKLGGHSDWRLPTLDEAMSLMEAKKQSNGLHINPIFDKTQDWIWTADKESASRAWVVYFYVGGCDFSAV